MQTSCEKCALESCACDVNELCSDWDSSNASYRPIGAKFPAPFVIPTYSFQQKNSMTLTSTGSAIWIQIILGQFLDASNFHTGVGADTNGTSNVPTSVIFYSTSANVGVSQLTLADISVVNANINAITNGTFNAVRPGPMCVKVEYTGRADAAAGTISAGISYSNVSSVVGATGTPLTTNTNGLWPDLNYSTTAAIEDLPFGRNVTIPDGVRCIYVPHDFSSLNLRNPIDVTTVNTNQRLNILAQGLSTGSTLRITIVENKEGIPSKNTADWVTCSYNPYPLEHDLRGVYDYIIKNNLVITSQDNEIGLKRFVEMVRNSKI